MLIYLYSLRASAIAPQWFINPDCGEANLCAVGMGETSKAALGDARTEMAKFFQTEVRSKTQLNSSSVQKDLNAGSGSFEEWTTKSSSEETSEILTGVEVKKQEVVDGVSYVLLALDRKVFSNNLRNKIEELDNENVKLLEGRSRFAIPKVLKNLSIIETLQTRFLLVSKEKLIIHVSKNTVLEKILKLKPIKFKIVSVKKKLPSKINHLLTDILTKIKVVIVPSTQSAKYILKCELVTEDQYLKIEGFKKVNVQLKLELQNNKNAVLGKMSVIDEQVARTLEQAIEKAIPQISEYTLENINQLSNINLTGDDL